MHTRPLNLDCAAILENSFQKLVLTNQVLKHLREFLKAKHVWNDLFLCASCFYTDFTMLKVIATS